MILRDAFAVADRAVIARVLAEAYARDPENVDAHLRAMDEALALDPLPSDFVILVKRFEWEADEGGPVVMDYDVSGVASDGRVYGLSMTDWREWLSMAVVQDVRSLGDPLTMDEMVAHVLWEMTWFGMTYARATQQVGSLQSEVAAIRDSLEVANDD